MECREDYYLVGDECLDPLKYELLNCSKKGDIKEGYQKCEACDEWHISYNYKDHRICLEPNDDFSKYIRQTATVPSNCKALKLNGTVLECLECNEDYFLNEQF